LLQLVTFQVGSVEFGIDILSVQQISRMLEITPLSQAPPYVEGAIDLRGKAIPIVDLRKRFNLEAKECDNNTRIVVVEISGNLVGMIVDSVSEVLRTAKRTVEPPSGIAVDLDSGFVEGLVRTDDRAVIILNLVNVIDPGVVIQIES